MKYIFTLLLVALSTNAFAVRQSANQVAPTTNCKQFTIEAVGTATETNLLGVEAEAIYVTQRDTTRLSGSSGPAYDSVSCVSSDTQVECIVPAGYAISASEPVTVQYCRQALVGSIFESYAKKNEANVFSQNQSLTKNDPKVILEDNSGGAQRTYSVGSSGGVWRLKDETGGQDFLTVNSSGELDLYNSMRMGFNGIGGSYIKLGIAGLDGISSRRDMQFFTYNNGEVLGMTLDNDGRLGIGTDAPASIVDINESSTTNTQEALNIRKSGINSNTSGNLYTVYRGSSNNADGFISVVGGTLTLSDSSDVRKKEEIVDSTIGLDEIVQLRPVKYKWKTSGEYSEGFIAQEVEAILPHAVSTVDDSQFGGFSDSRYLSMMHMIPGLVKSIKDLKELNDGLKARIEALEAN